MIFKQTVNNKCHHYFTIIQLHMSEKNIAPKYQFTIAKNKSKPFNSTTYSAKNCIWFVPFVYIPIFSRNVDRGGGKIFFIFYGKSIGNLKCFSSKIQACAKQLYSDC